MIRLGLAEPSESKLKRKDRKTQTTKRGKNGWRREVVNWKRF